MICTNMCLVCGNNLELPVSQTFIGSTISKKKDKGVMPLFKIIGVGNRVIWHIIRLILTKIGQLVCQVMKIWGFSKFQICFCTLYVCIV